MNKIRKFFILFIVINKITHPAGRVLEEREYWLVYRHLQLIKTTS